MRLVFGFVSCLICAAAVAQGKHEKPKAAPDLSGPALDRVIADLDRKFAVMPDEHQVPGMAVAIVKDDKVLLCKGYGLADVKAKRPVTTETMFELASCSKAFNAALVMFGVDEGKISLTDSPHKYLPFFGLADPDADRQVTVADLMCHRSGLPRTDDAWASGKVTSKEAVALLKGAQPTYPYGLVGQYSNVLVQAAGEVASAAYGKSWADLAQEKIFGPLGMAHSTAKPYVDIDPKLIARGYRVNRYGEIVPEDLSHEEAIVGAGGVKSCAQDMANWVRFQLSGGMFDGRRLMSASSVEEMHKARFDYGNGTFSGLGWFTDYHRALPIVTHAGFLGGFESAVVLVPDRHFGFVVLTNNSGKGLNSAVADVIINRLVGQQDISANVAAGHATGLYFDKAGKHVVRLLDMGTTLYARFDSGSNVRLAEKNHNEWVTYDKRQPNVDITFDKSPYDERSDLISCTWAGEKVSLSRTPAYRAEIAVDDLMRRCAQALGEKENRNESQTLAARYTAKVVNQNLQCLGLCFFGPGEQVGWFERDYALGRPLFFTHSGIGDSGAKSSSSFSRADDQSGNDVLDDWLMPLPFQESDWKARFKKVEIVGKGKLNGADVYFVLKTPRNGFRSLDYVSSDRFLVLRREYGNWPTVEILDDYKQVEGRTVPTHITGIDSMSRTYDYRLTDLHFQDRAPHWAFHPSPWPGFGD